MLWKVAQKLFPPPPHRVGSGLVVDGPNPPPPLTLITQRRRLDTTRQILPESNSCTLNCDIVICLIEKLVTAQLFKESKIDLQVPL